MTYSSPVLPISSYQSRYGVTLNLSPNAPEHQYAWKTGDIVGMVLVKARGEKSAMWHNLYVTTAGSSVNARDIIDPTDTSGSYDVELQVSRISNQVQLIVSHDAELLAINIQYDGSLNAS